MRLLLLVALVGCGGRASTPTSAPSNSAAPSPDASSTGCYPYAMRDGACLTKCDWSRPHDDQGCAKDNWPLICNADGTCTPEQRFDR